jgi:hypothetical protein
MAKLNTHRNFRDPSALTDYEKRIYDLRNQGKTWAEIAAVIGNVNARSVAVRYHIIKDKLASQ